MADRARSFLIKFLGDGSGLKSETASVKTSLGSIKTSIAEAEGASGKFKAAAGGAFQYAKEHAGQLAMAGGAALVTFGIKAVHAYEDAAKAAIDLGAATGLAVEDASRWIAVGDDFGLTAQDLEGSIGKVVKSLDSGKWEKYGVATRDAGGNARNTNAILVDSLAMLSSITNETERAKVGNELFGKGYQNLAPLIGHTKDEYEKMLGQVSDGQVITAEEAAKAERMRLAEDALKDSIKDVQLAVGGLVAEMSPLIEKMASAIEKATELAGAIDNIPQATEVAFGMVSANPIVVYDGIVSAATTTVDLHGKSLDEMARMLDEAGQSAEFNAEIMKQWREANGLAATATDGAGAAAADASLSVEELRDRINDAADRAEYYQSRVDAAKGSTDDVKDSTFDYADALKQVRDDIDAARDALQKLTDQQLEAVDGSYAYQRQAIETSGAIEEYNQKLADGKLKGDELWLATDEVRQKMVDTAGAYAETSGQAAGTKGYIDAMITSLSNQAAALDPSSPLYQALQGYIAQLLAIPTVVETDFRIKGDSVTVNGHQVAVAPRFDGGGIVPGPRGKPTLIVAEGGETVLPTHKGPVAVSGGGGGDLHVHVAGNIVGDDGVRQLFAELWAEQQRQARGNR